jgi:hypothetical protein
MSKSTLKRMMSKRSAPLRPPLQAPRTAYNPPSNEQLANFVAAVVNGAAGDLGMVMRLSPEMAGLMLAANPTAKRDWLQKHQEFQEALTTGGAKADQS